LNVGGAGGSTGGDTGFEPIREFSEKTTLSATGAAESGAVAADLEAVIAAWPAACLSAAGGDEG
jgi:hypothetical protein